MYCQKNTLSKEILEEQVGPGMINPTFCKEMPNLVFIANDIILGDDIRAVILSLINDFNRIASLNLKHNLELSQYYAVGEDLMSKHGVPYCANCELVLKYIDIAVCIVDGYIKENVKQYGNKFFESSDRGEKEVKCTISRGVVRFYIKQIDGNTAKYTPIKIARVKTVESLEPFMEALYYHNNKIAKVEGETTAAVSVGHSTAIRMVAGKGELRMVDDNSVDNIVKKVDRIFTETKIATLQPQLSSFKDNRILSTIPDQEMVDTANTVAKNLAKKIEKKDLVSILVPGNNPISLGIKKIYNNSSKNEKQVVVPVEANVAIVPTSKIIEDPLITVTKASDESQTAKENKLVNLASTAVKKVGTTTSAIAKKIGETVGKIGNYFKYKHASIVPVSKDLGVMTSLQKETVSEIPVPQESKDLGVMSSLQKETESEISIS